MIPTADAYNTGPCTHWPTQAGACGEPGIRYLPGIRCLNHSPAVLNGRTVPIPDPAGTLDGLRRAAGIPVAMTAPASPTAVDRAAIASGKRRSTPSDYQRARDERKARR